MKVLLIQLARLGDVFQTWPTFRALQRAGAEVHVLVRPRFQAATQGCEAIAKVHEFRTDKILGPVLTDGKEGLVSSMASLDELLASLTAEKFDRIVNLSFSPMSSWIAFDLEMRAFAEGRAVTSVGYSRHADGSLAIPDDASAYFFAQVGSRASAFPGEALNRISLPRLFATIAQGAVPAMELEATDWSGPQEPGVVREELLPVSTQHGFFAVHVGASEAEKTLDSARWAEIAARVMQASGSSVLLLGSQDETEKGREIARLMSESYGISESKIVNAVGRTKVGDVFPLLKHAALLIAGDSALVHMASLVGTRVLNLSSRTVSHWETGPLSKGSRVVVYGGAGPQMDTVIREATAMLTGGSDFSADREVQGPLEEIASKTDDAYSDFLWSFVSGLYMGTEFAVPQDGKLLTALQQWIETAEIEAVQLEALKRVEESSTITSILERVDEVTALICEAEPRLAPLYRWLTTERSRVGPQAKEAVIDRYLAINAQLSIVLKNLYSQGAINDRHELEL